MQTLAGLAIMAQVLLVMGQDAPLAPRDFRSGRGAGDHGDGDHGWGGKGYGGPFGDGGSGCAKDCVSSYWATAEPTPTAFCDSGNGLHSCISSACSSDASEWTSYSSRSASLCSEYLSCSSTGTYTYSYQTNDGGWGGRRGGADKAWPTGDKSWPTGEVVVTGCPWNGDGWGFPYWGGRGYGSGFWDDLGPGWSRATVTTTVSGASSSSTVVVEEAVSGDVSTLRTLAQGAVETGSSDSSSSDDNSAASTVGGGHGVMAMGIALGTVMAVVGLM